MVTMNQQAHRFAYLVKLNPEETLEQLMGRMRMPAININVAIWKAVEMGLIAEPNKETHMVEFLKAPDDGWDFGEILNNLFDMWEYAFTQLAKMENDLEENYVANWLVGYDTDDVEIVKEYLVEQGRVGRYEVEDGENTYVFYTGIENVGKEWGRKQFKKEPVGTFEGDAPIIPENGNQEVSAADLAANPSLGDKKPDEAAATNDNVNEAPTEKPAESETKTDE